MSEQPLPHVSDPAPVPLRTGGAGPGPKPRLTDELKADVIRLWNAGKTAGEIAELLPATPRSSVLGIVNRARAKGLVTRAAIIGGAGANRGSAAGPPKPGAPKRAAAEPPKSEPTPAPRPSQKPDTPPPPRHHDPKEPYGCRWIYGDTHQPGWRYCQAPQVPGESWCASHLARVYQEGTAFNPKKAVQRLPAQGTAGVYDVAAGLP